ncbi:SUMO-conjugating enzyme UBC9-like protein [Mycena olivaceomarginata]|nr:SUMO-conjugating enzyme UBC9-like protein [Mycena olivaceomarginata]
MPVVDLRQWQAHIPGRKGTPWEGGVYSLDVIFSPAECVVPKLRFIRPLFHPNASPSGTWSYSGDPGVKINYVYGNTWVKTTYDGPERFAQLLQTVQNTLHEPNLHDPAQGEAYLAAKNDFTAYECTPDPRTGLAGRPILHSS